MKISLVEKRCSIRRDRRTDKTKLIAPRQNFEIVSKKKILYYQAVINRTFEDFRTLLGTYISNERFISSSDLTFRLWRKTQLLNPIPNKFQDLIISSSYFENMYVFTGLLNSVPSPNNEHIFHTRTDQLVPCDWTLY